MTSVDHRRQPVLRQCAGMAAATLSYPFGEDTAVFKVGDKMFALVSLDDDPVSVTLKCEPAEAAALRDAHEAITPGYYMNKRHWITVDLGGTLPAGLVTDLVANSYELVVSSLPRKLRPAPA
jgi:predicted DNA-binding protein (MmcQ/YjbR family)